MVVGRSKRGKSSTANTILGEERFSVSNAFSQNIYSDWHQVTRDGRTIEVRPYTCILQSAACHWHWYIEVRLYRLTAVCCLP